MVTISINISRLLNPMTNPNAYMSAAASIYAASTMIYNAVNHHGVITTSVIVAAVSAVGSLFVRGVTTPTADPRIAPGVPLMPAYQKDKDGGSVQISNVAGKQAS